MRRKPVSARCSQLHVSSAVLACLGLTAGCTTTSPSGLVPAAREAVGPTQVQSEPTIVVRHGRYTLVELKPETAQADLLEQLVDVTFPAVMVHSVSDALRYVLLRSGYRLREDCNAARVLDVLPLPAPHAHLGPLPLRIALQLLAGPGWQLERDDASRTVCFAPVNPTQPTSDAASKNTTEHSYD